MSCAVTRVLRAGRSFTRQITIKDHIPEAIINRSQDGRASCGRLHSRRRDGCSRS